MWLLKLLCSWSIVHSYRSPLNRVISSACRIALTKLDILDTLKEIKVGVAYKVDGETLPSFPGKSFPLGCLIHLLCLMSECLVTFDLGFVHLESMCVINIRRGPGDLLQQELQHRLFWIISRNIHHLTLYNKKNFHSQEGHAEILV